MKKNLTTFALVILSASFLFGCATSSNDMSYEEYMLGEQQENPYCADYLEGVIIPLKDNQFVYDTEYIEAANLEREAWDTTLIPAGVNDYENQGYLCFPYPYDYHYPLSEDGEFAQPEVIEIEWSCELEYSEFYFTQEETEMQDYINQGYLCDEGPCWDDILGDSSVWLCAKE
jgi:hypothetical protein